MHNKFVSIGKILNFHGIQGEFKVGYSKGKENQLLTEKFFYLFLDNEYKKFTIEKLRFHKNIAIIKLVEINSINEAIEYKGQSLFIPIENLRNNLDNDEFLVDDLVGVEVINNYTNELIGKISYIQKQGNSDLLAIKNEAGNEYLVPFVKDLVPVIDLDNQKIYINAIEGLID